jgi:hypothetical protein
MGVRTSAWGPIAWAVLFAVAEFIDDVLDLIPDSDVVEIRHVQCLATSWFTLVGFILPCSYCRVSYRNLTSPSAPANDIKKVLREEGAFQLLQNLKSSIDNKLLQQKLSQLPSQKARSAMQRQWKAVAAKKANRNSTTKRMSIRNKKFWEYFIKFAGYVMGDYKAVRQPQYLQFFDILSQLLHKNPVTAKLGVALQQGLSSVTKNWDPSTLQGRMDAMFSLVKPVFILHSWKVPVTAASLQQICQKAIVGTCG